MTALLHFKLFSWKLLNLFKIAFNVIMIWKLLIIVSGVKQPIIVYKPLIGYDVAIDRGDILILSTSNDFNVGDIVSFNAEGYAQIIHRIIQTHKQFGNIHSVHYRKAVS